MHSDQMQSLDFFETARRECPTHFGITAIPKLFPDVIATGTVHNAISAGVGPDHRKINGRIILERDSFLAWLTNRPKITGKRAPRHTGGRGDA